MAIKCALLSVSEKTGIIEFANALSKHGIELLCTGGTYKVLHEAGLEVKEISDYTDMPELFDGRVKTLHPKVHGGLLYKRDHQEHIEQAKKNKIPAIDLLVVNLYPFEQTIAKEGENLEQAIENIDIGGPAMIRSAAKNYKHVTVVCNPPDYGRVLEEIEEHSGDTSLKFREELAVNAFLHTSDYDAAITNYLSRSASTHSKLTLSLPLDRELRYGDNPHQQARFYGNFSDIFSQIQGKDLSYTNILDIEAASELITDFARPTLGILKHTNPCGVGQDDDSLRKAWELAYATDKQAPFGGVIVMNRPLTGELARIISNIFTDVIIAPDFETDARAILQKKKNLRLIKLKEDAWQNVRKDPVIRSAPGGLMIMDRDHSPMGIENLEEKVVTKRPPSKEEIVAMRFGWRVVKNIKSNAIVYCHSDRTLGIGAGQMSRVDASRIAIWKAQQAGLSLKGSVVASDAMLPFADGLVAALEAGASACIQPGGSVRDQEVIDAANAANIAMVFTTYRHFKH